MTLEELSKSLIWLTTPMQQRSKSGAIGITPLLVDIPKPFRSILPKYCNSKHPQNNLWVFAMARPKRFELPFSGIGIRCVIQLRHGRIGVRLSRTGLLYTNRAE